MPYTPEQIAMMRKKEAALPDAMRRDPNVNYYEGWFHVTLNTRDGVPVLSICEGDINAADGTADAPRCRLTQLGKAVEKEWRNINRYYKYCICDELQVMPEHIHALLHLLPGNKGHLGRIVNGLMIGCTHAYWDTLGIPWREMRKQLDDVLKHNLEEAGANIDDETRREIEVKHKALIEEHQDRLHMRSFRGPALFVRGYNDMEAITDDEVEIKRQYIRNNPRKRLIQGYRHECFQKHRNRHSRNWTLDRVMNAVAAAFSHNTEKLAMAQKAVKARLNADERGIALDYIGNVELLSSEKKLPLVCHRADANLFEVQKEAVINAARNGFVIVSAFISQKERDIKQLLIAEQLPFVEIIDNGIAEKYKGVGKSFYALAERKLCQITPWKYRYEKDVKVSREMCMVMNELSRVISGRNDDWWK